MRLELRVRRPAVSTTSDERRALTEFLEFQRGTLLVKVDGLTESELRRVLTPSGVSLLGLVKHLTAVEHSWFERRLAQRWDEPLFVGDDGKPRHFEFDEGETADGIVERYLAQCERSRAVLSSMPSLDTTVRHPTLGEISVRWVLLHMIEETARHNGHADVLREQIDGVTGE